MTQQIFAGVDVGGTNIKVGLVDSEGNILNKTSFPTKPEESASVGLQQAYETIIALLNDSKFPVADLIAIGLATPGPMDIASGSLLTPFNLPGWQHQNVREVLTDISGLPVAFNNDANAAAYGEFWLGSGRQFNSIVLITLGTGVGGGVIIDEVLLNGSHSHGAEIGHMLVEPGKDARLCSCGKTGHLEAYASATGLVKRAMVCLGGGRESSLSADESLTPLAVYQAANEGDELAIELISEVAFYSGTAIVSVAHLLDPQAIFIGGAMTFGGVESKIGKSFLDQIKIRVKECSLPSIPDHLTIDFATLGSDAGFIGAAGLAKQHQESLSHSQMR